MRTRTRTFARTARTTLAAVAWLTAADDARGQSLPPLPHVPGTPLMPAIPSVTGIPELPSVGLPGAVDPALPVLSGPVPVADDKPAGVPPAGPGDEKPSGDDAAKTDDEKKDKKDYGAAFAAKHAPVGTAMSLGECIATGLDRHAALKAATHSLAATEIGAASLNNLSRLAERFTSDLDYRKQQSARGITVATAEIQKTRNEIVYDVTRLYWSYVYASQQEKTASSVIEQMETFYGVAKGIIDSGVRDPKMKLNQFTLYGLADAIGDVRKLRITATAGKAAALDALKEAMGVPEDFPIYPRDTELPLMEGAVTREQVLAFATSRRPELAQAAAGVDAFRLEVCAQAAVRNRQKVPTLASGSDLHSKQVPMADRGKDYAPGAIPLEMPPMLVGKSEFRVARATQYSLRQEAVYEKVVQLVKLEAANAHLTFEAATERLREAKSKYENARKLVEESRAAAATRQDPELLIRNEALAGKAQAEYLEAVFEHVKALATLERVTAGGVSPGFPGR